MKVRTKARVWVLGRRPSSLNGTQQTFVIRRLLIALQGSWCACGPDPTRDKERERKWSMRQFLTAMEERITFRCYALSSETKFTPKAGAEVGVPIKINK